MSRRGSMAVSFASGTPAPVSPFDRPHYEAINAARRAWLDENLDVLRPFLPKGRPIVLDAGCGHGYFTEWLAEQDFVVHAADIRPENVSRTAARVPEATTSIWDVEAAFPSDRTFDLVFCFGLLYHLENPLAALRNLRSVTKQALLLETRVSPGRGTAACLYSDGDGADQAVNGVAFIPTLPGLVRLLRAAGFEGLYAPPTLPRHPEVRQTLTQRQKKLILLATLKPIPVPSWNRLQAPVSTNRYQWYRFGTGRLLDRFARRGKESS